jgi:hypothetical protein
MNVPTFTMSGIEESRCTLVSAKNLPLPSDFSASPDQAVRGTFVGSVKAIVPRRKEAGVWTVVYEIETLVVLLEPM